MVIGRPKEGFTEKGTMAGRNLGGTHPNSPKNKGKSGGSTNKVLVALILVAVAFSSTTMFLISPTISRSIVALENMDMAGSEIAMHHSDNKLTATATPSSAPLPPGAPRKSVSDLISWMLSKSDRDTNTQHSSQFVYQEGVSPLSASLEFSPGSLSLTHAQTLQFCFADPKIYGNHFQGGRGDGSNVPVSYSDIHKLAYVMLPKSGSSTARHTLKNEFQAREGSKSLQHDSFKEGGNMRGWEVMSFVRDPLSRFFSQYDEAYVRTAPWQNSQNLHYVDPGTKKQRIPHPFPYLYENLHSYQ